MTATAPGTSDPGPDRARRPIVVGVDGSPPSRRALAWAVNQARETGTPLVAVAAWELPAGYGWPVPIPEDVDYEGDVRAELESAVDEVVPDRSGLDITTQVVNGHPAVVLQDMSASASLLVVGSRGHGGFTGMLLGSVSRHLTAHAACPVVVVREGGDGARGA